MRIGIGYDIHKLVEGRNLMLGGAEIPYAKGLLGHSDADVLMHAIADALLGAAALGDIGMHFPDTDAQYKDISGAMLLARVVGIVHRHGYTIGNVDSVVIAEEPKVSPYIGTMRACIAAALKINADNVNVKATTHEGIGPIGRGEAIAAEAVAGLIKNTKSTDNTES